MRELPADFELVRAEYIRVGTFIFAKYNIPPELIINADETAVLLAPRAKQTRYHQGAKRVRVIGVGDDKAQITAMVSITASGDVLDMQLIFGGKTKACHPNKGKTLPPAGLYYDHTESHWQTPLSMRNYINHILIPYKSGALKPRIPEFVLTGKAALETPEMRAAIQKSFREDGLFEIMQQPERVAAAKRELLESGEFLVDLAITEDVEIDQI